MSHIYYMIIINRPEMWVFFLGKTRTMHFSSIRMVGSQLSETPNSRSNGYHKKQDKLIRFIILLCMYDKWITVFRTILINHRSYNFSHKYSRRSPILHTLTQTTSKQCSSVQGTS